MAKTKEDIVEKIQKRAKPAKPANNVYAFPISVVKTSPAQMNELFGRKAKGGTRRSGPKGNTANKPVTSNATIGRSFKIEDVIRMGKQTFFEKMSPKSPLPMPHFEFTDEENERMDQILADQRD